MFTCDYRKLSLSFNEFHNIEEKDMPDDSEFCLLELKDGRFTAGKWMPDDYEDKNSVLGEFIRGTADAVPAEEVSKWHSLVRYDLSGCLEDEEIDYINLGPEKENAHSVVFKDFKSLKDGDFPKSEQYCLLLLMNGGMAGGRWDKLEENKGRFIYAPALASYKMDKVWAWTALSPDDIFEAEEEEENERRREEELNKNPSADPERFKYGTDVDVYYKKALEKLLKEYPWATVTQMKKRTPWEIVPCHGQYVFGQTTRLYNGSVAVSEWKDGSTADEFIDFLCEYTRESVRNSDPAEKFRYGLDVEVYLDMAYEKVRKDYRWLDKKMLEKTWRYAIRQVNGDWEFVRAYGDKKDYSVCDCSSAERFIENVEYDYQNAALAANPAVATFAVPFGQVDLNGWYLEKYEFIRLKTGDYKVNVQAGNRVTGGNREFFITPYCFEADTYEEFLDRYLKIVPGASFGIYKEDLLPNSELKKFLGY